MMSLYKALSPSRLGFMTHEKTFFFGLNNKTKVKMVMDWVKFGPLPHV